MKLLACTLFLTLACTVHAKDINPSGPTKQDFWRFQTSMENGSIFIKDVKKDKDEIRFWLKAEYDQPFDCKKLNGVSSESSVRDKRACEVAKDKQTARLIASYVLSCSLGKTKRLQAMAYNYDNELIKSSDVVTDWSPIYPETAADAVSRELCKPE